MFSTLTQATNIDTHTTSVHSSVDRSLVKLAISYGDVTETSDRRVEVDRTPEWNARIDTDITRLKKQLTGIISSDIAIDRYIEPTLTPYDDIEAARNEFKFHAETALRLINGLEVGRYGNHYDVVTNEPVSCGLTAKEIVAISYAALDHPENWSNPEKTQQHLMEFVEHLYVSKRGYNIDRHGEDEWRTYPEEDDNKCLGGTVNEIVNGLKDHKAVEIKVVAPETMEHPLSVALPDILHRLCQEDETNKGLLNQWIRAQSLAPEFLSKIIKELQENVEFSEPFNQDEIDRIGKQVLNKYSTLKLQEQLSEKYPDLLERYVDAVDEQALIHSFIFNQDKGYVPYLEDVFIQNPGKFRELLENELRIGIVSDLGQANSADARKTRFMLDLLLCGQNQALREASLRILLEHFAEIDQVAKDQFLILAVEQNLVSLTRDLIDNGANMLARDQRYGHDPMPLLHVAAQKGRAQIIQMLLERKPELANVRDDKGHTPMLYAAKFCNTEIAKMLLERMTPESINVPDNYGGTALHYAAEYGKTEIFRMILGMYPEAVNATLKNGLILHRVAHKRKTEIAKILLEIMTPESINNARNYFGQTALHVAAYLSTEVAQLLLEKMTPESINAVENRGYTALHLATQHGETETAKMLLERMTPESINAPNNRGETALHLAAQYGKTEIAKMLLERMTQESINAPDNDRETALHYAIRHRKTEIAKMLLEKMTPEGINAPDNNGQTALHGAARNGHTEIARLLLEKMTPKSINAKNKDGYTALHEVAWNGQTKLARLLLEKMTSESINAKNKDGNTALDVAAKKSSNKEIENLIQQRLIALEALHRENIDLAQTAYHDAPLKFIRFIKELEENGHSFTKGEENPFRDINIRDQWSDREKVADYLQQESKENPAKSNLEIIIDQGELKDLRTALSFKTSLTAQEKASIQDRYPDQANALLEQIKPKGWYLGKHLSKLLQGLGEVKNLSGVEIVGELDRGNFTPTRINRNTHREGR